MASWSKLSSKCAHSVDLAELADEHPRAFILFTYMLASAGVWGRYAADPRVLKAVACPMVESLTRPAIVEALEQLEARGMIVRYDGDEGEPCLAIANYHEYNSTHNWSRVEAPPYPHPPGWTPPAHLQAYLRKVADGECRDRHGQPLALAEECARLRIDTTAHSAPHTAGHNAAHNAAHDTERARVRAGATETETETETEQKQSTTRARAREEVPEPPAYGADDDTIGDVAMRVQNHPELRAALDDVCSAYPAPQRNQFLARIIEHVQPLDPNSELHRDALPALIRASPPTRLDMPKPQGWLRRTLAQQGEQRRRQAQQGKRRSMTPSTEHEEGIIKWD